MNKPVNKITVMEEFVTRLFKSTKDFIVRGSFVSRFWMGEYARSCEDLDLLYLKNYDENDIVSRLLNIISEDTFSVQFLKNKFEFEPIWQDSISPGFRFIFPYTTHQGQQELQVDVSANDPLLVPPVSMTILSDAPERPPLEVLTVKTEIAAAWKFHGLFEHINGPWMSKTLWDLYILCKNNELDKALLEEAIKLAFDSRLDPIEITQRFLYGDFAQSKRSQTVWQEDIALISSGANIKLNTVIDWLREYLSPIIKTNNHDSLLTLQQVIDYRLELLRKDPSSDARKKLQSINRKTKIIPKAYSSIPHLPGSRTGPSDRTVDEHKARMCIETLVNNDDIVVVQEKLDGSCVSAIRLNGKIIALGKQGDLAEESPNQARRLWAKWVHENQHRFMSLLDENERACGEWLALAHGTEYELNHEPFVLFDLINKNNISTDYKSLKSRAIPLSFTTPYVLHSGNPISIEQVERLLGKKGHHGATYAEGAVWRYERNGRTLFRTKYVRNDKQDGCLLPEYTGQPEVWNWYPENK